MRFYFYINLWKNHFSVDIHHYNYWKLNSFETNFLHFSFQKNMASLLKLAILPLSPSFCHLSISNSNITIQRTFTLHVYYFPGIYSKKFDFRINNFNVRVNTLSTMESIFSFTKLVQHMKMEIPNNIKIGEMENQILSEVSPALLKKVIPQLKK